MEQLGAHQQGQAVKGEMVLLAMFKIINSLRRKGVNSHENVFSGEICHQSRKMQNQGE